MLSRIYNLVKLAISFGIVYGSLPAVSYLGILLEQDTHLIKIYNLFKLVKICVY